MTVKARRTETLLPLNADHRCTGTDHIEFTRRSPAQVDDPATTIRPAIRNTHNNALPFRIFVTRTIVPKGNVRWARAHSAQRRGQNSIGLNPAFIRVT
jgi:hypothetical protein